MKLLGNSNWIRVSCVATALVVACSSYGGLIVSDNFNQAASQIGSAGSTLNDNFSRITQTTSVPTNYLFGFSGSGTFPYITNYTGSLLSYRNSLISAGTNIDAGLYAAAATDLANAASALGGLGSILNDNFSRITQTTSVPTNFLYGFSGSNTFPFISNYLGSLQSARDSLHSTGVHLGNGDFQAAGSSLSAHANAMGSFGNVLNNNFSRITQTTSVPNNYLIGFSGSGSFPYISNYTGNLSAYQNSLSIAALEISAVPEPSAYAAIAFCVLGLGLVVRKRLERPRSANPLILNK